MKKVLFIPILLLVLFSCSPDEETQAPTNTVQTTTPEPEPVVVQYTLTVSAAEGGTVSSEGGTYDEGTEVTISATPNEGYEFISWEGDFSINSVLLSTETISVTLNSDIILTPVFASSDYSSSAPYNLNIVYFTPKDFTIRNDSHRRISEILLQGQAFMKEQMESYGFGEKTFGLLTNNEQNRVKIIYLTGKFNASNYPYSDPYYGGDKIKEEIDSYFMANPQDVRSQHTLVIIPVDDPFNSNAPYYGTGRWSFATDNNDMDVKYLGGNPSDPLTNKATTFIGGLMHELGHALNLPHNKEKVSESLLSNKGTALMGAGNYTYGTNPTFLTKASCAILNNNEVFNETNRIYYQNEFYYQNEIHNVNINNLNGGFTNGKISLTGSIESDIAVNSVNISHDPIENNGEIDWGYDAVTWNTTVADDNTFSISMPINELYKTENTSYNLQLFLTHVDGGISMKIYQYAFEDGVPSFFFE